MARKMQRICTRSYDVENGTITFEWADATKDVVEMNSFPLEMQERFKFHGAVQKIGDTWANSDGLEDAKGKFNAIIAQLMSKDWTARSGGGTGPTVWLEAIVRVTGQTIADVRDMWETLTDEQRKKVKQDPRVKKAKLEVEMERLGDVDTDTDATDLMGL